MDREIAVALARAHYEAFEWSGCDGSAWHRLPQEARERFIRGADEWRATAQSAGYTFVPTETIRAISARAILT